MVKTGTNRLYGDLSWIWPMWEDLSAYRDDTGKMAVFFKKYCAHEAKTLLDAGCGMGKNAAWFKKYFSVTGIDLSEDMLKGAAKLNPGCEFIRADMRDFRLGRLFDCVFINDSINHMTSREELGKVFGNAYDHLKDGGVMICIQENDKETFKQNHSRVFTADSGLKPKDVEIAILENNFDPDPGDDTFEAAFVYLIRRKGKLSIEHDRLVNGLFHKKDWTGLLESAGFRVIEEKLDFEGTALPVFVCVK